MAKVATVAVVRKNHPDGYTVINKSDMLDGDKIYKGELVKDAPTSEEAVA